MNFFASSHVRRQNTGGLADLLQALHRVFERGLHLRVPPVADVAERGRKIIGPDEHAVDALDRRDGLDLRQRLAGLDLHQRADLARRVLQVILHAAVAAGAARTGNATHALWRITRPLDRALGLLRRLHERQQQGLRADVEIALDQHHIVPGGAHDAGRRAGLRGLQLQQDVRHVVGRMLGVEQEPVEAGVRDDLGGDRAAQAAPQPDLKLALGDGVLERVTRHVH